MTETYLLSRINMRLRRLGGSYGVKATRGNLIACACSLAAHLLQRPVRMIVKMETMMEAIGKRYNCYINYEVGCSSTTNLSTRINLLNVVRCKKELVSPNLAICFI